MPDFRQIFTPKGNRIRRSEPTMTRSRKAVPKGSPLPSTPLEAHARLRHLLELPIPLDEVSHQEFLHGWVAIASIAPSLNPDEATTEEGGWPLPWRPLAQEAFRRFAKKELNQNELHPSPARF